MNLTRRLYIIHLSDSSTDLFLLWVLWSTSLPSAVTTQWASKGHAAALLIAGIKGRRLIKGASGGWIWPVRPNLQGVRRGEVSQIRVHWGKREATSVWTLHPGRVRGGWCLGCWGSFWITTINLHAFIYCDILGVSMGGLRTRRPHRFSRFLWSRIRACNSHAGRCQQRRRSLNLTKKQQNVLDVLMKNAAKHPCSRYRIFKQWTHVLCTGPPASFWRAVHRWLTLWICKDISWSFCCQNNAPNQHHRSDLSFKAHRHWWQPSLPGQ